MTYHKKHPALITENDTTYNIDIQVPGYNRADISLMIEKDELIITGKLDENPKTYTHREWTQAPLRRVWRLPDTVDQDGLSAKLENGILSVKLTKKPEMTPKQITIA